MIDRGWEALYDALDKGAPLYVEDVRYELDENQPIMYDVIPSGQPMLIRGEFVCGQPGDIIMHEQPIYCPDVRFLKKVE